MALRLLFQVLILSPQFLGKGARYTRCFLILEVDVVQSEQVPSEG